MLNYEDFKAVVKDQILSYVPKEYRSAKVVIKTVKKVNALRDALWLQTEDMTAAPIVYLDILYKKYKEFQDFSQTMYFAIEWMFGSTTASDLNVDEFLKDIEEKIIFSVVGTQQNESLLKLLVHKDFLDMSLIYSVLNIQMVDDKPLLYTAKITNAMAEHYHLTPEDL